MPDKERNKAPIRFKSTLENEFSNGDKIFDFINQRNTQKFYNLQLKKVIYQGGQCLGISFVHVTDQLLHSNFDEQIKKWKQMFETLLDRFSLDIT